MLTCWLWHNIDGWEFHAEDQFSECNSCWQPILLLQSDWPCRAQAGIQQTQTSQHTAICTAEPELTKRIVVTKVSPPLLFFYYWDWSVLSGSYAFAILASQCTEDNTQGPSCAMGQGSGALCWGWCQCQGSSWGRSCPLLHCMMVFSPAPTLLYSPQFIWLFLGSSIASELWYTQVIAFYCLTINIPPYGRATCQSKLPRELWPRLH